LYFTDRIDDFNCYCCILTVSIFDLTLFIVFA
jgi:hypothetical protein